MWGYANLSCILVEKSIELDELFLDYMKKDKELDPIREFEEYKKFNYIEE